MYHLIRANGLYLANYTNQGFQWTDNSSQAAICDRLAEAIRVQELVRIERGIEALVNPLDPVLIGYLITAQVLRALPDDCAGIAINGIKKGAFIWTLQLPRDRSDRICWQLMTGSVWYFPHYNSGESLGPKMQYLYPANQWLGQHQFTLPESEVSAVSDRSRAVWERLRYYDDARDLLLKEFQKVGL